MSETHSVNISLDLQAWNPSRNTHSVNISVDLQAWHQKKSLTLESFQGLSPKKVGRLILTRVFQGLNLLKSDSLERSQAWHRYKSIRLLPSQALNSKKVGRLLFTGGVPSLNAGQNLHSVNLTDRFSGLARRSKYSLSEYPDQSSRPEPKKSPHPEVKNDPNHA